MDEKQPLDRRMIIALVVAALFFVGGFIVNRTSHHTKSSPSSTSTPSGMTTFGAANAGAGSGVTGNGPSPVATGATSGVSESGVSSGLTMDQIVNGSGKRAPQSGDTAADEAALKAVVPTWAECGISSGIATPTAWANTFSQITGASAPFVAQSSQQFYTLWSGAMQQGVSVNTARIASITPIKNEGPTATYKVVVEQDMTPNVDGGVSGTVKQAWTFTVAHVTTGSMVYKFAS